MDEKKSILRLECIKLAAELITPGSWGSVNKESLIEVAEKIYAFVSE